MKHCLPSVAFLFLWITHISSGVGLRLQAKWRTSAAWATIKAHVSRGGGRGYGSVFVFLHGAMVPIHSLISIDHELKMGARSLMSTPRWTKTPMKSGSLLYSQGASILRFTSFWRLWSLASTQIWLLRHCHTHGARLKILLTSSWGTGNLGE